MKTFKGRIEDLVNTGKTSMDGYTPEEAVTIANQASEIIGTKFIFDGIENEIKSDT